MENWIAVWEALENIVELEAPRGSHFVYHFNPTEGRMVITLVRCIGGVFFPGPTLPAGDTARLLTYGHHLRLIYSQPPNPLLYLREAVRFAGGAPGSQELQLMA